MLNSVKITDYLKVFLILLAFMAFSISSPVAPDATAKSKSKKHRKVKKDEKVRKKAKLKKKKLSGKALFNSVWTKTKINSSKTLKKKGKKPPKGSVAGVRGNKKDGEYLQPYWKGDDKEELEREAARSFQKATKLMDDKDFEPAISLLEKFLKKFAGTKPEPQARVALGLCLAQTGQNPKAENVLSKFVEKFPAHPLAPEVAEVINDLKTE